MHMNTRTNFILKGSLGNFCYGGVNKLTFKVFVI